MLIGTKSADMKFLNGVMQSGELRGVFGGPRRVVFAKLDFEVAFCWQNIHGQAAMPQGDTKPELRLAFQAKLAAMDGHFKYPIKGSFRDALGIEKAKASLLDSEFLQMASHELDHNVDFFGCANGDPKFAIFKFS
jgi:hypothetical protein